jgi:antitoxin VapB
MPGMLQEPAVPNERSVRLFRNGANQAVRIPRELELPGNEALIRKEGDGLIIIPKRPRSLLATLKSLKPLRETFPSIGDRQAEPVDL